MAPTLELLTEVVGNAALLTFEHLPCGAAHYAKTGDSLPASSLETARAADAILLAFAGDPRIRYPDGTEITPQIDLRIIFDLYAGVRPVRIVPGQPTPLINPGPLDFVLIRESTEELFHTLGKGLVTEDYAEETLRITRGTTEKLCQFAFRLAARRRAQGKGEGRVTSVDKANVFRAFAFFRGIFDAVAKEPPEMKANHAHVDAIALFMVTKPTAWDVMVTENMFGDILSDLGASLMGGLGMAPSTDIGDRHAVFKPCHGSAPDIAGKGMANPMAMILSGAMMLDWLGDTHDMPALARAARRLEQAVDHVVLRGVPLTRDLGGSAGTMAVAAAIHEALG